MGIDVETGMRVGRCALLRGRGRRAAVAGLALSAVLAGGSLAFVASDSLAPTGPARAGVALAAEGTQQGDAPLPAEVDTGLTPADEGEASDAPDEAVPEDGASPDGGDPDVSDPVDPAGPAEPEPPVDPAPDDGSQDASGDAGEPDVPAEPDVPTEPDVPAEDVPTTPDGSTAADGATSETPVAPADAVSSADSAQVDAAEQPRTGTRFSLADEGLLTPVRNQYGYDTCWAFAAMSSLESSVLRTTGVSMELSPFQAAYFMSMGNAEWESASNGNPYATPDPYGANGSPFGLAGSLAAGKGAAAVEYGVNDFGSSFVDSLRYASDVRLTGTIPLYSPVPFWETPDASSKIAVVQDLVRNVGPVTASMCADKGDNFNAEHSCFYAPENAGYFLNHEVAIVGWDDDYPRENFNGALRPQSNGAWLIKNSWGAEEGEGGYFWVSYEDQIVPESVLMGELARSGEKTYQTDVVGWNNSISVDGSAGAYMAAAYTSDRAETLDRVMFATTGYSASYDISVYRDLTDPTDPTSGILVSSQSGFEASPGHHTVWLDTPIDLSAGDKFSIVVQVQNAGYPYPVAVEAFNPDPELGAAMPTYMTVDDDEEPELCYVSSDGATWRNPVGYGRDVALGSGDSFCVTGVSVKGLTMPREETVDPEPEPDPDARFSLLDEGLLTPVRDQSIYGMCWAFGYLSSLESTVLRSSGASLELSPFQSSYFMMVGDEETEHALGGNPYITVRPYEGVGPTYWLTGSLAAGKGAASVEPGVSDWGNPSFDESLRYESDARLTDSVMLYDAAAPFWEEPSDEERTQVIKDLVRNVGPVAAEIYGHMDADIYSYEHGSWRIPQDGGYYLDHLVSIVGWDDTYPRENFVTQPESDGAWLIKNSWGTDQGNEGYFWLSYDSLFQARTVLVGEQAREGEKTYQFDEIGWMDSMTLGDTGAFMANVFTSERAETLDRAMFVTTGRNTAYTVSVYRNPTDAANPTSGELVSLTEGVQEWPGYHTVTLDAPVDLSAGDTFALVVRVQNDGYAYPIAVETFEPDIELPGLVPSHMGLDDAGNPEVSLVSTDGVTWENPTGYGRDLAKSSGERSYVTNVSVKALTMPRDETIDPDPDPDPTPDPDPDPTPDPDPAPGTGGDDQKPTGGSGSTTTPSKGDELPRTGDETPGASAVALGAAGAASLAGAGAVLVSRRRRRA